MTKSCERTGYSNTVVDEAVREGRPIYGGRFCDCQTEVLLDLVPSRTIDLTMMSEDEVRRSNERVSLERQKAKVRFDAGFEQSVTICKERLRIR